MFGRETPEKIARELRVSADAVLSGNIDLSKYPHRHLAVVSSGAIPQNRLTAAVTSAEILERWGFELVNLSDVGDRLTCAIMRRR